jgi:hypothetical protein
MEFHLYSHLEKESRDFKGNREQLAEYLNETSKLTKEHAEIFYLLIMHHYYIENPKLNCKGLPYNGKKIAGKKGFMCILNPEKIDKKLLRILGYYLSKVMVFE